MSGGGAIVVLVEDHEDTREIFTVALIAAGYRVYSVATYDEARGILDTLEVAVLVLDLGREGAGLNYAAEVRRRPHRTCLIAVTGRALEQDRRELLFDAYILKPCLPEHLVLAVERVLARR